MKFKPIKVFKKILFLKTVLYIPNLLFSIIIVQFDNFCFKTNNFMKNPMELMGHSSNWQPI